MRSSRRRGSVFEFKEAVLAKHGASASCSRVVVPADLRGDWPEPLRAAGFDPAAPTAWLAAHGWRATTARVPALGVSYGRPLPAHVVLPSANTTILGTGTVLVTMISSP